jgi:uncharacterized DUF497 family protein
VQSDRFEWDDHKAELNLIKHRVRFEKAIDVFDDFFSATYADLDHYDEENREITYGSTLFNECSSSVIRRAKTESASSVPGMRRKPNVDVT